MSNDILNEYNFLWKFKRTCDIVSVSQVGSCAFAGEGLTAAGASVSPLTGDESNVVLWIVVGAVALAGIVGIVLYLMKRKK